MHMHRRHVWQGVFGMAGCMVFAPKLFAQSLADTDFLAPGIADQIISGDRFTLRDGRHVRLAGVEAPKAAQAKASAQPLARGAKAALAELVAGQEIMFSNPAPDRFGRVRAHVTVAKTQNWVQGELIRQGLARVRTWPDDFQQCANMLEFETMARNKQLGIWVHPFYAVRTPENVSAANGSFQLVEGEIVDAAATKKMIYLNFGANWRRDFTAQADKKTAKLFTKAGIDLAGLSGARVRVRGLVGERNGPTIWLNHPTQLEILAGD